MAKSKEVGAIEGTGEKVPASAVLQRMQRAFLFGSGLWSSKETAGDNEAQGRIKRFTSEKNEDKASKTPVPRTKVAFARFVLILFDPFWMRLASVPTSSRTPLTRFKLIHVPACCM